MSKGKIMALISLITLVLGVTAVDNAVADEASNEAIIEGNLDEIWYKGNLDVIDEIAAVKYVRHMHGGQEFRGR